MSFSEKIKEIRFDRSSGASEIAQKALGLLGSFVESSRHETLRDFLDEVNGLGRTLLQARPNMAPVQNFMAQILYEVNTLNEDHLEVVRQFILSRIKELRRQHKFAFKEIIRRAADVVGDSDCLITCSYSSTIFESLKFGKQQGKRFKVLVAESKTDSICYGKVLANSLKSVNVDAQVFPDNELHRYVLKTNCALVGTDSILCDGSVINGTPSHKLAVKAKESGVPFFSVCETTKVNTLNYLGKTIKLQKGFDIIPANLIAGIITEKGIIDTDKIVELMKQYSKFFTLFLST